MLFFIGVVVFVVGGQLGINGNNDCAIEHRARCVY